MATLFVGVHKIDEPYGVREGAERCNMLGLVATGFDPLDPISQCAVMEVDPAKPGAGWVRIEVRAATVNHHDLWTLRGVGTRPGQFPVVLGNDASGVDADGNEVMVYPIIGRPALPGSRLNYGSDETLDPRARFLSVDYPGCLAEYVWVPAGLTVPKPTQLSFEEASCLPGAWLTAFRMLFEKASVREGQSILVQGATGGVGTALLQLGKAAGLEIWASTRDMTREERLLELGATHVLLTGESVPSRVDAVMDTVGEASWESSLRSLRRGGSLVVSGATSGGNPPASLARIFDKQLTIRGAMGGTLAQLEELGTFCIVHDIHPEIDSVFELTDAVDALRALERGGVVGKIVVVPSPAKAGER